MTSVYAIATMDTKGAELEYVQKTLSQAGISVVTVDVGTSAPPSVSPTFSRDQVWRALGTNVALSADRGTAIRQMSDALRLFLLKEFANGRVCGVIGLGGSGGTSLITAAMRALPIGLPKLMVSTVASGNVAPYVDCCDITMMYSVVDIAGLNAVSETVLSNAAHAMVGMASQPNRTPTIRKAIGMTMFGVTTPCVTRVRAQLESEGYDCLVFHATGTGGRAMEQLVASGLIAGVLDITTTEVADEVVGGVFPSGPHRFEKILAAKVPLVFSLGALDMVNFGALHTIPEQFRNRKLHIHNDQVTLMRTSVEENRRIAAFIADKLNQSIAPMRLLIPERGLSLIDVPGQPFHDPEADAALFNELQRRLRATPDRQLIRLPLDINAEQFSTAMVEHFNALVQDQIL
ncbi:MAG TPA: hypothetical protein DDZ51_29390 [Planctomycetaceae bacterium]|nr:hypothetical protein [Planctomycetaceae bacterium]